MAYRWDSLLVALMMTQAVATPQVHALPLAYSVVSFTGGEGFGVEDNGDGHSYTGPSGEGAYDPQAVTALDGVVLGLGGATESPGTITLQFSMGEVIDGAGPDLRLYDTHFFLDGFNLDTSTDGSSFTRAFSFSGDLGIFNCSLESPCIADIDLSAAGLASLNYLRITAAGNSAQGFPEAYTLDAVEALNFRSTALPEPGTLSLLGLAAAALGIVRRRHGLADIKDMKGKGGNIRFSSHRSTANRFTRR